MSSKVVTGPHPWALQPATPKPSTEDEFIRDMSRAVRGMQVTQRDSAGQVK